MPHNRYIGFLAQHDRGYVVAFSLHWQVIESRRVDPSVGAARSLTEFIGDYERDGWQMEGEPNYGFVFMNRSGVRILVEATPRDPYQKSLQSFSPYK